MKYKPEQLYRFIITVLQKYGVPLDDAEITAKVLVKGDSRGHHGHGISRLTNLVTGIKHNTIDPKTQLVVEKDYPSSFVVNGNHGLGHVIAEQSMQKCIQKAKETGIACASIYNTTHFGIAGYYAELAAQQNMIGIVCCNTEPWMSAGEKKKKVMGTNPLAIGIPTKNKPLLLDFATSSIPRGKIMDALKRGENLPPQTVLDKEGNMTTDPQLAVDGSILPFGGAFAYKIFGLATVLDILSGLSGASLSPHVRGSANTKETCTKGDFMLAIDISKFNDLEEFKDKVERLKKDIKDSGENIFLPGEIEDAKEQQGEIDLPDKLLTKLEEFGVIS